MADDDGGEGDDGDGDDDGVYPWRMMKIAASIVRW